MIDNILQFVLWVLLAYFAIKWIIYIWHQNMKRQLQHYQEVIERLNDRIHEVRVETHGDNMNYWFDSHSDEFLAQGRTLEDIVTVLKVRFPDHVFLVPGSGGMGAGTDWKLVDDTRLQNAMITTRAWSQKNTKSRS